MASETNFHYEADDSLTFVDVAHVDKRIVGGTNVVQGTYTWAVKSTYLWSDQSISICSGSILSNKWILTAAHCCVHPHRQVIRSVIEAGNPNVAVIMRFHRTCKWHIRQRVTRMKTILLETVSQDIRLLATNDIALLKLSTPFDLTRPNISAVNLPTTNNSTLPNVNESGVIVGFGIYLHPDIIPTTAQVATFKVDTHQRCAQRHAVYIAFNPIYNFCVDDDDMRINTNLVNENREV
ncbi:trypsin [Opisthorchis viverrini]|uniref:Trypsin n=1 Tax=Opisthorchis viverrini TaxID=6198 RepID=A0A1S8WQY7_OPIVI|nr:trypsin [Opisthorchis viverrini]